MAGSFKLTATMAKSLSFSRLCNFSIKGISIRHSGHHVVQKLRNTILPLKSERVTFLPCMSKRLISTGGAIRGTLMIPISRNNRSVLLLTVLAVEAEAADNFMPVFPRVIRIMTASNRVKIVTFFSINLISLYDPF